MKKSNFIILILFLSFHCAGPNQETIKKATGHRDLGISYLNEGNYTQALKELQEAEKLYADDPELQNALGLVYYARGAINEAEAHYKKAIKLKNDYSEAHNNLGVLYLNSERLDEAIHEFSEAVKNIGYATPERAYMNMGWAYYRKKNYREAEVSLKKAIQLAPDFFIAHYHLGNLYKDTGKYNEAIKEYKLAIKYFPRYIDAYYNLAHTYIKIKRHDYALQMFKKVCELGPDSDYCERSNQYIKMLKK